MPLIQQASHKHRKWLESHFKHDAVHIVGNQAQHLIHEQLIISTFKSLANLAHVSGISPTQEKIISQIVFDVVQDLHNVIAHNRYGNLTEVQQGLYVVAAKLQYADTIRTGIRSCNMHYKDVLVPLQKSLLAHQAAHAACIQPKFLKVDCFNNCVVTCTNIIPHIEQRALRTQAQRYGQLAQAAQTVVTGAGNIRFQKYQISAAAQQWLALNKIPLALFETKTGNAFEQALHQQAVNLLNNATASSASQMAYAAAIATHQGNSQLALACTDLGHAALNFAQTSAHVEQIAQKIPVDQQGVLAKSWHEFSKEFTEHIQHTIEGLAYLVTHPQVVITIAQEGANMLVDMAQLSTGISFKEGVFLTDKQQAALYVAHAHNIINRCNKFVERISAMSTPQMAGAIAGNLVDVALFGALSQLFGSTVRTIHTLTTTPNLRTFSQVIRRPIADRLFFSSERLQRAFNNARINLLNETPEVVAGDIRFKVPVSNNMVMEAETVFGSGIEKVAQNHITENIAKEILEGSSKLKSLESIIAELEKKTVDKKFGLIEQSVTSIKAHELATAKAEQFYTAMRNTAHDIEKIAHNTGIPLEIVKEIKSHVFFEKHILSNGITTFPACADMANAWQRLIEGTFVQSDLKLLLHEYAEALLMRGQTVGYDPAHYIVNKIYDKKYNWEEFAKK